MIALSVLSGFILAAAAPVLQAVIGRRTGWVLALLPAALTLIYAAQIPAVAGGARLIESVAWIDGLGIRFSFLVDGLGLVFALLVSGIGTLVVVYSGGYLAGNAELGRFYLYLLAFMASMLGVVLASNLITLFVFWELTSFTSYLLIGFEHRRASARDAALQALLVTGIGGLALLAGFLLMGHVTGTLELADMLGRDLPLRDHALYGPILILVLLGAFTKSAQVPFHFWLPSAMEGPTPVSAFLHSATMVKAGVYLVLRLTPILGGTPVWQGTLAAAGAATMILGAAMALFQTDMKRLLAYTTVNGLGVLVFLTGLGTPVAVLAAILFLIGHALYKGALFLTAGVVDHETGTRDIREVTGLWSRMPMMATAAVLACASMAGLPPLLGFIAKESIYDATLHASHYVPLATGGAVLANALLFAAAGLFVLKPFFGRPASGEASGHGHPVPASLWLGPAALAGAGLVFGLLPSLIDTPIVAAAAGAVTGRIPEVHLSLFHGLTPMLGLSLITIALGVGLYLGQPTLARAAVKALPLARFGAAAGYEAGLSGLKQVAAWQTRLLQTGYLHHYVLVIILASLMLVGITLLASGGLVLHWRPDTVRVYEAVIAALMLAAAWVTVRSETRLSAIVAVGVVGYGMALIFLDFGAPDLAMTQFIIETMTVILFALVIYHLPPYTPICSRTQRVRDAVIAGVGGGLMCLLVLVALSVREGSRVAGFFKENSLLMAHGSNIVNVIIVDFRGMDTLGEITVLALAGAGVYTLLKLRPERSDT